MTDDAEPHPEVVSTLAALTEQMNALTEQVNTVVEQQDRVLTAAEQAAALAEEATTEDDAAARAARQGVEQAMDALAGVDAGATEADAPDAEEATDTDTDADPRGYY